MSFPLNNHHYDENDRYVIEAFDVGAFTAKATANTYEEALLIAQEAIDPNGLNCIAAHIWQKDKCILIKTISQNHKCTKPKQISILTKIKEFINGRSTKD
jgi:hypothetical protein